MASSAPSDDSSQPHAIFVSAWATLEESGNWGALDLLLNGKGGERVERDSDEPLARRLAESRRRIADALDHERVHGRGSLLVADHPFNVEMGPLLDKLAERRRLAAMA